MGYTHNESMVRVDFFKPSGKWYATDEFSAPFPDPHTCWPDVFKAALVEHLKGRYSGMYAVVISGEDYIQFPLMFQLPERES